MSDSIDKKLNVNREVDALKAILDVGIPGAPPIVSAYLQAALHVIESQGAPPEVTDRKDRQSLDSLGGGRIL